MTTNQSIEYQRAEARFAAARTDEEKLEAIKEMIKFMPKHKSAEQLRANIKTRYKKLREKLEAEKKKKKSSRQGIKKAELQAVLIGLTQSGKSSILANLTNAKPKISSVEFTTLSPIIGTLQHEGIQVQIIDMPAINHENFDSGIANNTDLLLIVIVSISQLEEILPFIQNSSAKKIIIFNKSDLLREGEKRKISAFLSSKKYNFVLYSSITRENEIELKEKIISSFNICRIYTKSPGQKFPDNKPVLMPQNSTISDIARKIRIPVENIKQAKLSGPSSKFPNQIVGLQHVLKDKDIVEFKTE